MRGRGTRRRVRARTRELGRVLAVEKGPETKVSLTIIGRHDLLRPLLAIVRHSPSRLARQQAAYAIAFLIDRRAWLPQLNIARDRTQTSIVRGLALEGLAYLMDVPPRLRRRGFRKTVSALMEFLEDEDPNVRFWAIFALGQGRVLEALPRLEALAASDDAVPPGLWRVGDEASDAIAYLKTGVWPDRE